MYVDPGPLWDQVIAEKQLHPRVPIVMIVGPNNGPGTSPDPTYALYVAKAQAAGIVVLGYVYSSYATRAASAIETDISNFKSWYGVNGIFIDEMATNASGYYQTLTAYAHADGLTPVIGNPGADAPATAGTDSITFFEQQGYPTLAFLSAPAHTAVPKSTWSYMAGAVPFDQATILATLPYVGYIYATDSPEPECYCVLPTYFDQLVATLDR